MMMQRAKRACSGEERPVRIVTVMFTRRLTESSPAAETHPTGQPPADEHGRIVLFAIRGNNGVLAKSLRNGTLSWFEHASDAVRAAVRIQRDMDELNMSGKFTMPALIRIGMHTGKCVVEEDGFCGGPVKTASRLTHAADAGGILLSEDTYKDLPDKFEIYCRFARQVMAGGKDDIVNVYRAFWVPQEIEIGRPGLSGQSGQREEIPARTSGMALVWIVAALIGAVLLLTLGAEHFGPSQSIESTRSIDDAARPPPSDLQG